MRLLYVALDQTVPGTLGGSVHVQAVAEGLAALGHEIHVVTQAGGPWPATPGVTWHAMSPPAGSSLLRWMRAGKVSALARDLNVHAIMERYYNFGGEGILAANTLGIPAVLEVNAPIIDYPGSVKSKLDRALLVEPMRRWRDRLCRLTSLFVTPSASILPAWIDRRRILEVEWGADTSLFRPDVPGPPPFARDSGRIICVFAGAFRSWHGAAQLTAALARRHAAGDHRFGAVLVGDGPERPAAERHARGVPGITFTGAVSHEQLPTYLAAADIGMAPFDPARHKPLRLGFYWSPLKIFEYMACGLPVVAPRLPRLARLIEHGREGALYDPTRPRELDDALLSLANADRRRELGAAARARVVREFSWQAHCSVLDARLRRLRPRAGRGRMS